MGRLRLTYAGEDHFDRMKALQMGLVSPDGIDLNYVVLGVRELFRRQAQFAEFESSEMSVSTMTMLVGRGVDTFVGVPVFPSRHFRHRQVYVNVDAGIERPEDLAGKRIGVPEYQMTAALWIRAFLQHDHGVGLATCTGSRAGSTPPTGPSVFVTTRRRACSSSASRPSRTLSELLDSGELDAVAASQPPRAFREGSPRIRRLFPDYREVDATTTSARASTRSCTWSPCAATSTRRTAGCR